MPDRQPLLAGLVLAALVLASASAAETPSSPATSPVAVAESVPIAVPADTVLSERPASAMMLEIRAALDREHEQVEGLRARLRQAPGHREALALQREIEQVKLGTEAAILRIQAGAARRAGYATLAERLEVAAQDLLAPPRATTLATRPAPRAAGR